MFKSGQTIVIIEPHPDDAWLSMGGIILANPKTNFKIISVTKGNANGTKTLAKLVKNVEYIPLDFKRIRFDAGIKEFYRINGLTKESLETAVRFAAGKYYRLILPFGFIHPIHIEVGQLDFPGSWYYRDIPYFTFRKSKMVNVKSNTIAHKDFLIGDLARKKELLLKCYPKSVKEFVEHGSGRQSLLIENERLYFGRESFVGKLLVAWDIGNNNVLGRIRNIITFPLQIATFLGVYGMYFDLPLIVVASLVMTGVIIAVGWLYVESGLLSAETKARHNKAPQIKETLEVVKRLEVKLNEKLD